MSSSIVGLFAGLLVAIATAVGGFTGFLLAIVLGAVGWLVGAYVRADIDIPEVFRGRRD